MPFTPAQHKAHREKLAKKGICVLCHKREATGGWKLCTECRAKNGKHIKEKRAELTPKGICRSCLARPVLPDNKNHCKPCSELHRKCDKRRRLKIKENPLQCNKCGKPLSEFNLLTGRVLCEHCTALSANAKLRNRSVI